MTKRIQYVGWIAIVIFLGANMGHAAEKQQQGKKTASQITAKQKASATQAKKSSTTQKANTAQKANVAQKTNTTQKPASTSKPVVAQNSSGKTSTKSKNTPAPKVAAKSKVSRTQKTFAQQKQTPIPAKSSGEQAPISEQPSPAAQSLVAQISAEQQESLTMMEVAQREAAKKKAAQEIIEQQKASEEIAAQNNVQQEDDPTDTIVLRSFTEKELVRKSNTTKYWVFLPKQYGQDNRQWPLVMYLHGASERGKGVESLKQNVTVNFLQPTHQVNELKDLPFIVVAPSCPTKQYWIPSQLRGVINDVLADFSVDQKRMYLTGHSMGAFGTWNFASAYPDLFAAIVPVAGGGQISYVKNLVDIPTWAFHGANDTVVPARRSTSLVSVLNMVGGDAKLTLFPKEGHLICRETYSNPELWDWMLAQEKRSDTSVTYGEPKK